MFETTHDHGTRSAPDAALREPRSGLSGFGGRPSLHPAWRDDDARESSAQVTAMFRRSLR